MLSRLLKAPERVVKRLVAPYVNPRIDRAVERRLVQRAQSAESVEAAEPVDPILVDFNHRLHELRSIELRRLPVDGGVLLSAGCAGRWYFDWLEECAGPIGHHIGVELFSDEPDDLPAGTTWIAESAAAMPSVADRSVDVVFSGQNIEHLWIDQLIGFLTESYRVLRPDGMLVIDSPNRFAVEALGWVHPEHTIELTVAEATSLLEAAGFDVVTARGLWNCRDQKTGGWLPLVVEPGDAREMLRRSVERRSVDDDFVWWVEARRTDREPDVELLRTRVVGLFAQHWPTRVNRHPGGVGEPTSDGGRRLPVGAEGVLYRTHVFPIFAGSYSVCASEPSLRVRLLGADGAELANGVGEVHGSVAQTEFGVVVELVADMPLNDAIEGVSVAVTLDPVG